MFLLQWIIIILVWLAVLAHFMFLLSWIIAKNSMYVVLVIHVCCCHGLLSSVLVSLMGMLSSTPDSLPTMLQDEIGFPTLKL